MRYKAPSPPSIGHARQYTEGGNKPIDRLVIHATVSACCTSASAVARMFRITERDASAHYVIDATEEYQCVWDSNVAYHAPPNPHSLGFELCCSLSNEGKGHWSRPDHQQMLKRAARLVAEAALAYDVPIKRVRAKALRAGERGICGHVDVRDAWSQTTHWDPGPYFPWRAFIVMVKQAAADIEREAAGKPKRKKRVVNTKVRRARVLFSEGLDLLAAVPAHRKHVKAVASQIEDDIHRLPEQ